jgi:hypothetical protein
VGLTCMNSYFFCRKPCSSLSSRRTCSRCQAHHQPSAQAGKTEVQVRATVRTLLHHYDHGHHHHLYIPHQHRSRSGGAYQLLDVELLPLVLGLPLVPVLTPTPPLSPGRPPPTVHTFPRLIVPIAANDAQRGTRCRLQEPFINSDRQQYAPLGHLADTSSDQAHYIPRNQHPTGRGATHPRQVGKLGLIHALGVGTLPLNLTHHKPIPRRRHHHTLTDCPTPHRGPGAVTNNPRWTARDSRQ